MRSLDERGQKFMGTMKMECGLGTIERERNCADYMKQELKRIKKERYGNNDY